MDTDDIIAIIVMSALTFILGIILSYYLFFGDSIEMGKKYEKVYCTECDVPLEQINESDYQVVKQCPECKHIVILDK